MSFLNPSAIAEQVKASIAGPDTQLGKLLPAMTSLPSVLANTKTKVVEATKQAAANAVTKQLNARLGEGSEESENNSEDPESYENVENNTGEEEEQEEEQEGGGRKTKRRGRKTKRRRTRHKKRKNKSKNIRKRRSRTKKLA
jgi:hypothetical protein